MANALFEKGRNAIISGCVAWDGLSAASPACALVGSAYNVNLVAHLTYNNIPAAAVVASGVLDYTTVSASDGVADAADITFSAVQNVNNTAASRIVVFTWTGNTTTSVLLCYLDTVTGLPFTPNGGNVTITWDNGDYKIFRV